MTEIRPIREDEADNFLELLCDTFGLDVDRAHNVFYGEPFFDLRRKWALFEAREMVSILTTVPLEFGWGGGIGIAGVATRERFRREGYAARLIERVLREYERAGERIALLFAENTRLYADLGFEPLDDVIQGTVRTNLKDISAEMMPFEELKARYTAWSEADPARLRRDDLRWRYWRWNLRIVTPFAGGYYCEEGGYLRECIVENPPEAWPLAPDTGWFGLRSVAEAMQVPIQDPRFAMHFMGRNTPKVPQLFLTDQF